MNYYQQPMPQQPMPQQPMPQQPMPRQPMPQQPMPQQPMPQQPMPQQPMPQQPQHPQQERFSLHNQCWVSSNEPTVKNYDTPETPRIPQQHEEQFSNKAEYDFNLDIHCDVPVYFDWEENINSMHQNDLEQTVESEIKQGEGFEDQKNFIDSILYDDNCEWDDGSENEYRVDPYDNLLYTEKEFYDYYGRSYEWVMQSPELYYKRQMLDNMIYDYNKILKSSSMNYILEKLIETFD